MLVVIRIRQCWLVYGTISLHGRIMQMFWKNQQHKGIIPLYVTGMADKTPKKIQGTDARRCCVQAKATVVATNMILVSNISTLKIKQVFFFFSFILFAIVCPIISSTICLKPANWTPSFRFYYSNCRIDAFFYSRQSRQADKGSSRKYYFTRRPSRNYLLGNG